jgi:hypothetical protein
LSDENTTLTSVLPTTVSLACCEESVIDRRTGHKTHLEEGLLGVGLGSGGGLWCGVSLCSAWMETSAGWIEEGKGSEGKGRKGKGRGKKVKGKTRKATLWGMERALPVVRR